MPLLLFAFGGVDKALAHSINCEEIEVAAVKTCILVEDQAMFLELIHCMLEPLEGLRIAAHATTVAEGLQACEEHRPDIVILDLGLPDGSGFTVARHAIAMNPAVKIILLSGQLSDVVCPSWINKHLHAAISKSDAFQRLREELGELLPGE